MDLTMFFGLFTYFERLYVARINWFKNCVFLLTNETSFSSVCVVNSVVSSRYYIDLLDFVVVQVDIYYH